jgi:membrane fusion protein, multidrug efflux system
MKRPTLAAGIAVFVILGAVGGGLAFFKVRQVKAAMSAPPPPEYGEASLTAPAREISWQPMYDLSGTAFSIRSVLLSNELAGTVREVRFQSGSIVQANDVMLTLDDSIDQADLAAAEAAVRVAEANVAVGRSRLALAEVELAAVREAIASNASTPIELDRKQSEVDTAKAELIRLEAEVDQARSRIDQVRVRIGKHVLRAPFKARVGLRTVHEGLYLAEGTGVVRLEEITDRIYLDFAIPQEYLARVRPGLQVMATSAVLGPDPVPIEVVAIDAIVSNDTRNARVRGILDNPPIAGGSPDDRLIRPGMFVQIRVPVDAPTMRVVIPATALRRATYGDHVWVVAPAESPDVYRAHQRPVRPGPTVGDDVIVLEGLAPGEIVATSGSFKLRENVKVIHPASMAPPTPAAH